MAEGQLKVDLDYILVNELGQFGRHQLYTLVLVFFPVVFSAFGSGDYVFTVGDLPHRCKIPECDGSDTEYAPSWLLNAIPGRSLTNFDSCNRFHRANATENATSAICPAALFNRSKTVRCDTYVYDRTDSAVYDFDLACQELRWSLAGTLNSVGTLLVLPVTGLLSDSRGRRVALTLGALNTCLLGFLRAFSVSYEMYLGLQLMQQTLGAGAFSSCFLLATELVGPRYRVVTGVLMSSFFALGHMLLGLLAWAIQPWRTLTMVLYGIQVFVVAYFWLLPESVRWLLSKGKYLEAEKSLRNAAKLNRKVISDKTMEALIANSKLDSSKKITENKDGESVLTQIIKSPVMLRRCCTTPVWWVTATLVYYGLNINSVGLGGNRYVNYVLMAAIEMPAYVIVVLLLVDRVGRKKTLCIGYMACAVCCVTFAFIPNELPVLRLVLFLVGKFAISGVFSVIYIYTAELYPTSHRHSLLAFSSMVGRIGSISAPLTPALVVYMEGLPSLLFGAMALVSGVLVLTTPETMGAKMPDTVHEAETLGSLRT